MVSVKFGQELKFWRQDMKILGNQVPRKLKLGMARLNPVYVMLNVMINGLVHF